MKNVAGPLWPWWQELGKRLFTKQANTYDMREFIAAIYGFWQSRLFDISSLDDLISGIESNKRHKPVIKYLEALAKEFGVSKKCDLRGNYRNGHGRFRRREQPLTQPDPAVFAR